MKKILVVDDIAENIYFLKELLSSQSLEVMTAENGEIALKKAQASPPDLIISDILMPVMDGYSLCKTWKNDDRLKHIPFVFYTATYTDLKDEEFALSIGADFFLIKPQEPHVLLKSINDFLNTDLSGNSKDGQPLGSEMEFFRSYNERLFTKLEKKMIDLETANRQLNQEIAERRKTEEKLMKLTQAVEGSPVAILITDVNGNIEYANPKFLQMSGYSYEEIIGHDQSIFQPGEVLLNLNKDIWDTPEEKKIWSGELCGKKKSGEFFWAYTTMSPIRSQDGIITNFMVTQDDVSEKRKLEEQLRQAQKLDGIGQLASGIAHDFNNILTAIIGYAYLAILNLQTDDPNRRHIQRILEYSEKASSLTRNLLAFSRKQATHLAETNLNTLVINFQKFLEPMIRENIEVQTNCTDKALTVMMDKAQIEQVIMNLTTNSCDAMPEGGRLVIATDEVDIKEDFVKNIGYGKPGKYAQLSAADTGTGIDLQIIDRIFEPFFTTKEPGKGTGLGLAIVYGIVRKHNGYITVDSKPGKGATVKVLLPMISPDDTGIKKPKQDLSSLGGTETILLAEDESEIRKLLSTILSRHGYQVIGAADGEDALNKFREGKDGIDLVILDGIMPKKSGKEVFRKIRSIAPSMKIIFISGYSEDSLYLDRLDYEEFAYLPKPVVPADILKKVRDMLDGKSP